MLKCPDCQQELPGDRALVAQAVQVRGPHHLPVPDPRVVVVWRMEYPAHGTCPCAGTRLVIQENHK